MASDARKRRVVLAALLLENSDETSYFVERYTSSANDNECILYDAMFQKKRKRRGGERNPETPFVPPVRITGYAEVTVQCYTNQEFYSHFRMKKETFELVLSALGNQLSKKKMPHTPDIPLSKKALIALWILATPDSYRSVADRFGVSKGSAHYCVMEFISVFSALKSHYIKWPTEQEARISMAYIEERYGFPNTVGAVDGCHIAIKEPEDNKESYYNRKGHTSIILQGTCDHRRKLVDVCVGWPGSVHDARVWRNSSLGVSLATGQITLPSGGHLVADSAYGLESYLMTPYRDNGHMSRAQMKFNRTLSSARAVIERCFGQLKCKFRRLHYLDMPRVDKVTDLINTCCVLHNIILNHEEQESNDDDDDVPCFIESNFDEQHESGFHVNIEASQKRERIASNL